MRTQNLNTRTQSIEKGFLTFQNDHATQTFEVQDLTLIGRESTAQICINDPYSSNRHARIVKKETGFYIQDLRSRNGTFVNGSRILEAKLQDHDRIRIGLTEYTFMSHHQNVTESVLTSSQNEKWDSQLRKLTSISLSPHPVLIVGPSGTGKEVVAHAIHRLSTRSSSSFLSVNCSALTEALAESELFGHIKGSFTGAQLDRKGAFEAVRGGTLFLDEVGDMPLNIQPKLLRAIENKEIKAVGSDELKIVDVRIIAATNKNLKELVQQGKFREDLYFRLHILQIQPPTLLERMEDFDALLQYFARPMKVYFTIEALCKMKEHTWPGNVRELKNTISRASALFGSKPLTPEDIHEIIEIPTSPRDIRLIGPTPAMTRKYLKDYEKEAIIDRLILFKGNQRQASADLGMAKSTLHDRIRRYNINISELLAKGTPPPKTTLGA